MTKLTNADAYLKKVCTYNETGCGSCRFQTKCPADEPTIDTEPIRHGKWVEHVDDRWGASYYFCSECGKEPLKEERTNRRCLSNFCPNCGAKVIGTVEEGAEHE